MQKGVVLLLIFFNYNICSAQLFKTTLNTSLLSPAEKDIGNVKRIAVLDFENISSEEYKNAGIDIGSKLADYISISLLKEYRGKNQNCFIEGARTDIYSIVEREELQRVLEEKELELGQLSDTEIISIGQVLGVDAIILGNVSYSSTDERDHSSYRSDEGKLINTHTLKRTTSAEARMKILLVSTGEIIGQTSGRSSVSDTTKGGTRPNNNAVMAPSKLAEYACERIARQFANYIAPYYYSYTFTFEKVKHKKLKERVKDANEFLRLREIDKAYEMYDAIYEVDPYNAELVFNMGILNEVVGNYEKAKAFYSVAVNMNPDKEPYVKGLRRAEDNILLTKDLYNMGIEIYPYEFKKGSKENLLIERIKIKGSRSKRKIAYSNPDEKSEILGQFPGGLELDLLERIDKEKWIAVKLPNGEKGYFKGKDVLTGK
ncbi:CsgG/HfaB family protein [Flavivirga abyssicola]|uniref:CsgG/HfaB family protein n=1 Tax=Flavivirga abyssicola TaxID=3063533 RepID=UPI0026E00129|nr:CsgG/HfaB family protein [Flavivirga sp. MEBiC07777]WVK14222.1 CsgG/HfaB family protein [Flavivirga sp. MEBiC07777]